VFVAAPLLLIFGEGHEEGTVFTSAEEATGATEETTEEVVEG
jgi:hypothetical protein